jgi:hypothetical protein
VLITVDEIETILAMEQEAEALDEAIDAIKKTVRSSIRSRVMTNQALESQEQGTWGIASLFDV